ncbi:hypothetical protein TELCIR_06442 [Teladorsagia circumcincta]|uniref:Uncharacterized protein n=1 Tax=Teladorsagia circumcincta TaxID=45464 RepID=A0A2G9UPK8_TELCI|nr:hypothetical protein TELCIR_06442 [Teladorsagia circumcincta]
MAKKHSTRRGRKKVIPSGAEDSQSNTTQDTAQVDSLNSVFASSVAITPSPLQGATAPAEAAQDSTEPMAQEVSQPQQDSGAQLPAEGSTSFEHQEQPEPQASAGVVEPMEVDNPLPAQDAARVDAPVATQQQRASAVSAHLTRTIRSLQALQLAQLASVGDEGSRHLVADYQTNPPGEFSEQSVANYLQWWREHYTEQFHSQSSAIFRQRVLEETRRILDGSGPSASTSRASAPTTSSGQPPEKPKFKSGWFGPRESSVVRQDQRPRTPAPRVPRERSASPAPRPGPSFRQSGEAGPPGSRSRSRRGGRRRKRKRAVSRHSREEAVAGARREYSSQSSSSITYEEPPVHGNRRRGLPPLPMQAVPPPGRPPCVFCSSTEHFSAECDRYRHLNVRANLLVTAGYCTLCLRKHYGQCIRADGCGLCGELDHHQAICIRNIFTVNDIDMMAQRFYRSVADASYREVPPHRSQRQQYEVPRIRLRVRANPSSERRWQAGRDRDGYGQVRWVVRVCWSSAVEMRVVRGSSLAIKQV